MRLILGFFCLLPAATDIFGESSTSRLGGLSAYCDQIDAAEPPRRFKSSLLGGEIPYGSGSQRFILTQAQRKEYPPTPPTISSSCDSPKTSDEGIVVKEPTSILPEPQLINLSTQKKSDESATPEPVVRCSVIQRVSSVTSSSPSSPALATSSSPSPPTVQIPRKDGKPTAPHHPIVMHHKRQMALYHRMQNLSTNPAMMPVQEHPIDYHIPKKRDMAPTKRKDVNGELIGSEEDEDKRIKKIDLVEEREKRIREAKRAILHRALLQHIRRMPPGSPMVGRLAGIVQAAAGHGRSSSNNSGSQSNASGNASTNGSSGSSINFSAGSAGCGNSGAAGGLGGSGAGGNGRDNRSNYGPNSPPTGSLPPFYESLKGGANGGLNAYNAQNGMNGNAFNNYLLNSTLAQMDCDGNGELTNIGYPSSPQDANTKQYSVLQNVYLQNGMVLKDEIDLDYDGKIDTLSLNGNLLQNYGDGYTDSMMAELSNAVDPLQLTATLTFSSPNEHALLESLTDAVDLSQFLQRLPSDDDQCNDLELSSTSSLTPDSNGDHHQQHHNMDSFQDHLIGGRHGGFSNDRQLFYKSSPPSSTSSYENPPPYQNREHNGLHNSLLQQQHHHNIAQNGGFDLESSLPSPTGASPYDSLHSPQQNHHHGMSSGIDHSSSASTTPSPNAMTTIQNVSKSLKTYNRRSAAGKINQLLASTTTPEPPIVAEGKAHVLQQRVSKFYWRMEIIAKQI